MVGSDTYTQGIKDFHKCWSGSLAKRRLCLGPTGVINCTPLLGAAGKRKEPARQLFPLRLSQGPGMSLSSFCLTVVGLPINFWKLQYIVIRPRWKSPSLFGNA